jgi:hypothetical protein
MSTEKQRDSRGSIKTESISRSWKSNFVLRGANQNGHNLPRLGKCPPTTLWIKSRLRMNGVFDISLTFPQSSLSLESCCESFGQAEKL